MASNYQVQTFILQASGTPQGPYIIPPSFPSAQQQLQLAIYNLNGSAASTSTCAITEQGDNVDFGLSWQLDTSNNLYAQVTVQPTNVFSDAASNRQTLLKSFVAFRIALQQMEESSTNCLLPGGAAIITNWLAGALPLRMDEVLPYYYGFTPGGNYVDLQPGMRLRIDTGAYQYVATGSTLNAFTAQGQVYATVARDSNQQLYFDPYLNGLNVSLTQTVPPQIGNILDLTASGSRRYFRLFYPSPMNNPTIAWKGPGLGQNVTLIGADTASDLANATKSYLATRACTAAQKGNQPIICAYFTGRTTVVPEIPVNLMGRLTYVPLGTTVQNLLDIYNVMPPDFATQQLSNFAFYRVGADTMSITPAYGQKQVLFSPPPPLTQYVPDPASGGVLTQWDLPLVKGDSLSWQWT
jgi:hypothetical protein